eukprot:scaffold33620_cov51-Isochrysis_galbana.AAC.1
MEKKKAGCAAAPVYPVAHAARLPPALADDAAVAEAPPVGGVGGEVGVSSRSRHAPCGWNGGGCRGVIRCHI